MLYVLGLIVYNIFLHPLRSYPGPKWWAAFRFPYIYNQFKGRLPIRVKALHKQYGPVVRIAPNELAYTSAAAWKDIYGFRTGQSQNPKDLQVLPAPHEGQAVNIIRANDVEHGRLRRLISHAFSARALEDQQPLILSYVDLLIQRLKENSAQPQDMVAWYNWTTFDIIGDLTFGESFHGLRDQQWHPWVQTITVGIEAGGIVTAISRYGLGFAIRVLIPKALLEKFDQLFIYTKEKVGARLERGTERPDFTSYIMRNDKDGRQMSRAEMEANAEVLIVAGSETTASLLSAATYYLCTNPETLERVTTEVRNAFDSDQDINLNSVNKLDYLLAVLNESLRIYPPVPGSIPRMTVKGDMIAGRWVPPGVSENLMSAWLAYQTPRQQSEYSSLLPSPPPRISTTPIRSCLSAGFLTRLLNSMATAKMQFSHSVQGLGTALVESAWHEHRSPIPTFTRRY